ncbi:amino acid adenylation domain-containing protein [Tumebacillus sp. DT12]|uniref:Amino acid adenylation domain-containing protein n=1 Tax=Tumebacillus lacus TaxID=2995335 RepID=A0ABT3X593_9BACL|nr:non-ribosomal peptide synthetase [Tumebacillus lacus]MCX7571137.1 amino acid adenylation domain-containing protein [Tumebacillus lacus]
MNEMMRQFPTLVALLRERALCEPNRLAYTFLLEDGGEESLTYGELDTKARALAVRLAGLGGLQERALLLYQPGLDYIVAFFGCLYAGVYAVPAYPPRQNGNLNRLQAVVTDAEARFALTTGAIHASIVRRFADSEALAGLHWVNTDELAEEGADLWQEPALDSDSIAFLQYTSGSTSLPKGVVLSHGNLLHNLEIITASFATSRESRGVIWLPPYHDMGLIGGILQPLYNGYPVTLMAPVDFITKPSRWLEAISRTKATVSGGPNFAYDLCLRKITPEQRAALDLSSWQSAFSGAEPVRAETLERFADTFAANGFRKEAFYPCYGLAEGTLFVSGGSPSEQPIKRTFAADELELHRAVAAEAEGENAVTLVSSGRPALTPQRVVIAHPESLTSCAEEQVGEIWVKGDSVAQGYWRRVEQTESTFHAYLADSGEGPFLRTGDLGFLQDGELYVTGRLKDLIIIRGRNFYPQDLEFTVQESHPAVASSNGAAFSVEAEGEEQLVIVHEIERSFRKANLEEVVQAIRRAISEQHQLPVYAIVLIRPTSIPKTSSGKIQRHACKAKYGDGTLEEVYRSVQGEAAKAADLYVQEAASAAEATVAVAAELTQAELLAMPESDREAALDGYLLAKASEVLRMAAAPELLEQPLYALGIDSLMAVELKNDLEERFGVDLPLSRFLDGLTLKGAAAEVLARAGETPVSKQQVTEAVQTVEPGEFPQTSGQQSLFFLQRLAPDRAPYNISRAVRLDAGVDRELLREAMQAVVRRHPLLRATYHAADGGAVQRVSESAVLNWQEVDAGLWDEAELRAQLDEEANRPFDLERETPLRASLYLRGSEGVVLLLTVHHIATDFWSFGVFARDLGTAYQALQRGETPELAAAGSYAQYAARQAEMLAGSEGERLWNYWREQLGGALPVLSLPSDRPRAAVQSYRGAAHRFQLPPSLTTALKELAKENGSTLYMTLLAAFQVLLHRYSGQDDILVGSPTVGRSRAQEADVVGYFVNPVVLRGDLSAALPFRRFLDQVRRTVLAAMEHQAYPFGLLADRLQNKRDLSHSPVYQAMFTMQRAQAGEDERMTRLALGDAGVTVDLGGLSMTSEALSTRYSQLDLTLLMGEADGELHGVIEYSTDLFEAATIERMATGFATLLTGIAADPEQTVDRLPLVTAVERQDLLTVWNDTAREYPRDVCLHQLFEQQAARTPEATALVFGEECLTYGELNSRANKLARHLQRSGVGPDVLVGVCMERSVEMVVALYGILKAGAAYVPIDPTYPQDRLAYLLEDSGVPMLLTQSHLADGLPEHGATVLKLDTDWVQIAVEEDGNVTSGVLPTHLAYMIYTSGSTGRPKGAMNEHRGIINRLLWMQDEYGLTAEDAVLQKTPFSFDVSVWEFFWPLLAGARLVIARPEGHKDAAYLARLIESEQVTTLHFVPSMLQVFLEEPSITRCSSLRRVMCSGEALPYDLQERFFERLSGVELHNLYGPTEAAVDVTYWACDREDERRLVPIGRPVANTQVYVLDRHLEPVPVGVAGELHIGGIQVARGYHNRPDLTAEKFIADPFGGVSGGRLYKTGDLVRYLPDGSIEYLGRLDFQVKIRGFRIELGEIEAVLDQHEEVLQSVVTAYDDGSGHKRLVGYVVFTPGCDVPVSELRRHLLATLPEYMVPSAFVTLPEMPLSPNGKVERRALPAPEIQRAAVEYVAPRDEREASLAEVWASVLGMERVGLDDNYFELGGDSIRSIQVLSKAQERGLTFELQDMFQHQTIRELTQVVRPFEQGAASAPMSKPFDLLLPADRAALPDGIVDAFPLAKLQEGMLFQSALTPESSVYHNVISVQVKAPFDETALTEAVRLVIDRHPNLRSSFDLTTYSQSLQLVHESVELPLVVEDIRHLSNEEQEIYLQEWFDAECKRHFDWSQAPLERFTIHRRSEDTFQFAFTEHHVITDGWSIASLFTEFFRAYLALAKGEALPIGDAPTVSYRDFIHLEQAALQSEASKRYWSDWLAGYSFTKLPRLPQTAEQQGANGQLLTLDVPLGADVSRRLQELAQSARVPLKHVLLAAHLRVMSFVSGQTDVVTGVVANGRPETADGERVIGLHLNSLPYRFELAGGTWIDLIREVFEKDLEALPHRRYPMAQMQQDHGGQALFESLFNYINFHVYDSLREMSDLEVLNQRDFIYTDFPFAVEFSVDGAGDVQMRLQWMAAEFNDMQMQAMAGYFQRAFAGMTAEPEGHYQTVDLMAAEELAELAAWNSTHREYPTDVCLHRLFEAQVERTPDATAVVFGEEQLTYRELNERANRLAHHLLKNGVGADQFVGVCMERSPEMVVALYGVLKAGAAYVPIDPTYPQDRVEFMLADSGVSVLMTQSHLIDGLPAYQGRTICLDTAQESLASESAENPQTDVVAENLAYMIYTSGSTGLPKGAMNEHRGIVNRLLWMQDEYGLTAEDAVLQKTPFSFDVSVWEFFWPLLVGARLVVARPEGHRDSRYMIGLIEEQGITTMHFVPSMLQAFLEDDEVEACRSLRRVMCSGEALPFELQERFFDRLPHVELHNLYGPTEAAIDVTYWACEQGHALGFVPIGYAVANTQMHVLDRWLRPVPMGTPGELHIGGIQVARGYHNRSELTEERFLADPFVQTGGRLYKTGDLACYLPDGSLQYLGRLDHQVKVRGYRIELGEIENGLLEHPQVDHAAVLVRKAPDGGVTLIGFYTGEQAVTANVLKEFLARTMPDFMIPPSLVRLDEIPLSPNGKIDRKALERIAADHRETASVEYEAPKTSLQEQIAAIWARILKLDRVGVHDNFFDLGGHSILVMKVRDALQKELGLDIPITELFRYPTVKSLAEAFDPSAAQAEKERTARPIRKSSEEDRDIAIIGIGLRLPDANDVYEFWQNLRDGKASIREFPMEELEPSFFNQDPANQDKLLRYGAFLDDIDKFDAEFFNISEREARLLDPQQRIFLECAWAAVQNAGYNVDEIEEKVSVYGGSGYATYLQPDALGTSIGDMYQAYMAAQPRFMATRVAYKLNLRGEAMLVDTACSTSLVAIHLACESLLSGRSDYALAGGVTVQVPQKTGYLYEPNFIYSPDGHCRAFDASAAGTVSGNGAGVIFLKRLSDAQHDGDPIYAVIKGSAINNDGNMKIGYTAPSIQGQIDVIAEAQAAAGVDPDTITYIEAHGTGTNLGDPIEVAALTQVFRQQTERKQYCAIGSLKTNIGHLDAAAGVAGLIKAALALKYGEIPPSLNFTEPNPKLDLENSPFYVNTATTPWQTEAHPRRAGVSSFGIGGTNAHVILEEAPRDVE